MAYLEIIAYNNTMSVIFSVSVIMISTHRHPTFEVKTEKKLAKYLHHHAYNFTLKKLPLHPIEVSMYGKQTNKQENLYLKKNHNISENQPLAFLKVNKQCLKRKWTKPCFTTRHHQPEQQREYPQQATRDRSRDQIKHHCWLGCHLCASCKLGHFFGPRTFSQWEAHHQIHLP